jgi:hypothetical protein
VKYETLISIRGKKPKSQADNKKTMVLPSRRRQNLGRRRLSLPAITFYDLASINTGTPESPVYDDHPILKVPSYSIDSALDGSTFLGADYVIDRWANADYAAYYDRLFTVPVTEWKNHYRKIEYEVADSTLGTYPFNLLVRCDAATGGVLPGFERVFVDLAVDISTPTGKAIRDARMSDLGLAWDSRGLEYRNIPDLRFKPDPNAFSNYQANKEWFSMSATVKGTFGYKVTSANDPTAPDVGDLAISGPIDVYLIPHVGLFLAASYKGTEDVPGGFAYNGDNGMQVLGPWYQVMPRANWPVYVDPLALLDQELLKETFIDYQKNRTDAIATEWFHTTGTSLSSATISPLDFRTGNNSWKCFIDNTGINIDAYTTGNAGVYRTVDPFNATENVLMAVIKMHGLFYYVWSEAFDSTSNTATDESSATHGYALSVYPFGDEAP